MNPHNSEGLYVDVARPEDATAIAHIHFAAVHQTAAAWYSEDVRLAWSPPVNEERIERMRLVIERPEVVTLVVRSHEAIVGFGSLLPADGELRAVYVHPQWGRRGVGTLLLKSLEEQAQEQGVLFLQMDASLNAQRFYERNGYRMLARGVHRSRNGQKIDCVKMRKDLPVPDLNLPVIPAGNLAAPPAL